MTDGPRHATAARDPDQARQGHDKGLGGLAKGAGPWVVLAAFVFVAVFGALRQSSADRSSVLYRMATVQLEQDAVLTRAVATMGEREELSGTLLLLHEAWRQVFVAVVREDFDAAADGLTVAEGFLDGLRRRLDNAQLSEVDNGRDNQSITGYWL